MKKSEEISVNKCKHIIEDNSYCKKCGALYQSKVIVLFYVYFFIFVNLFYLTIILAFHIKTSKICIQYRYKSNYNIQYDVKK